MARKIKNQIELKLKCPFCEEYAQPNSESSENWKVFDAICPKCGKRYETEYWVNGAKIGDDSD